MISDLSPGALGPMAGHPGLQMNPLMNGPTGSDYALLAAAALAGQESLMAAMGAAQHHQHALGMMEGKSS